MRATAVLRLDLAPGLTLTAGVWWQLRVERVMLAPSGVILLLLTDPHDAVEPLRDRATAAWAGTAPKKQTRLIIHASLARVRGNVISPLEPTRA